MLSLSKADSQQAIPLSHTSTCAYIYIKTLLQKILKRKIMVIQQVLLSFPLLSSTHFLNLKMKKQAFLVASKLLPLQIIFLYRWYDPHPAMSLGQRQGHLSQMWS